MFGRGAMTVADENNEKSKALNMAVSQIRKQFGEGAVMRLGDEPTPIGVEVIPTGCLSLDIALGVGGLPRGRIVELYGAEGSGKTTIGLHVIAEAQKRGGTAAFIDAEHAFSREYAEICDTLVRSGALSVVVVDSVAALVPRAELEGEMGDSHVGLQARLMSQALRKIAGSVAQSKTLIIFVNQIREKIGVMFGSPETTPGGRALKFWSSVRLQLSPRQSIKEGNESIGRRVDARIVKNKVAPPFRRCEFDIIYGQGISQEGCILDEALELKLLEKSGSWFTYGDESIGQGRNKAVEFLKEHKDLRDELETKIRNAHHLLATPTAPEPEVESADEE